MMITDQGDILTLGALTALSVVSSLRRGSSAKKKKKPKKRPTPLSQRRKKWRSAGTAPKSLPSTSKAMKRKVVQKAREIFRNKFGDAACSATGTCAYWAWAVIEAGRQLGKEYVLQAGDAGWRMVPPHLDDGVSPTHFSYMWEPHTPFSRSRIAAGLLPEVHAWAGDPQTHEIIDLSTKFWPEQARLLMGVPWKDKKPPPYFWSHEIPERGHYRAHADATRHVARLLLREGFRI